MIPASSRRHRRDRLARLEGVLSERASDSNGASAVACTEAEISPLERPAMQVPK